MRNNKFRILMYGIHYVDVNRLIGSEGGYITDRPYLYDSEYTKEMIIQTHRDVLHITGHTEAQIKNLEHNLTDCRMVDIELVTLNDK